ncbi:hypothetical protein MIND_00900200 [Mycena indigotica]|uniref:Uncharacterized protein n=1 Tax=Mycena indigotica TaxID=2126181 RepID=A0A8H6SIY9_9AGAR|nr:uncharacterized protein MIND_00900200 [Mycena indigotica]KAF7299501.1 hypothetical protein MIND_00900200 [Mycena indigotica]
MSLLRLRQAPPLQSTPNASTSAGITAGATIGGVLFVALAVAGVFVVQRRSVRRERTARREPRRSNTIMSFQTAGDDNEALLAEEKWGKTPTHIHNQSEASNNDHQRTESSSSTASGTPIRPRIEISHLPLSTAFGNPSHNNETLSALSSACMSSASPNGPNPSPHSAFAFSAFAGPSKPPLPINTVEAARTVLSERDGKARDVQERTPDHHHSLHPVAVQPLRGGPSTAALMDLPSPLFFDSSTPISPSPISELDDTNTELGTTTLDALQLSEVIAAANWEWPDAPGARATIAALESSQGLRPAGPRKPSGRV